MANQTSGHTPRRLFFDLGVRGAADIYNALVGLATFSIIARQISQSDYGAYTQILTTTALLLPILLLRLNTAFVRFFPALDAADGGSRGRVFTYIALLSIALSLFVSAALLGMSELSAKWIFGSKDFGLIGYLALYLVLRCQVALGTDFFRASQHIRTATGINSIRVSLVLCLVVLAAQTAPDLEHFLLAHIAGELLALIGLTWLLIRRRALRWPSGRRLRELRPLLYYSIPLVPYSVMLVINQYADRYFITHILGLEEAGRYSFLYSMIAAAFLFGTSISYVVLPHIARRWEAGDSEGVEKIFRTTQCVYLGISIPATAGLLLLAKPLTVAFAGSGYLLDNWSIFGIVVGHQLLGMCTVYGIAIDLSKRTGLYLQVLSISASCNIILNAILVPLTGVAGAALSTALTYLLQLLLLKRRSTCLMQHSVRIEWAFAGRSSLATAFMVAVLQLLPQPTGLHTVFFAVLTGCVVYALAARLLMHREFDLIMAAIDANQTGKDDHQSVVPE